MCSPPLAPGRTRDHHPPALFRAFLHCYYKNVYGIRPVTRELQNTVVWLSCGFDRPPSRDAVDRFLTDLEHVVDEVFDRLVEQAACRGLLDLTYSIDSTDVRTMPADQDASKGYDQPPKVLPRLSNRLDREECRGVHREQASARGTAMRVTCDALAVETDLDAWNSAYDTLGWTTTRRLQRTKHRRKTSGSKPVPRFDVRGDGDARVTRSPSRNRSGCLETAPTTRWLARPPAGRRGRASRSVQRTKHRRSERHRVQGRSPHRRTQRGRSAEAIDARRDVQPPEWSRTNQRRRQDCGLGHVRARGRVHHEHKCSSRCAFVSLLRSPTTNAETIQEAPSSRYENYSMTPSICISKWGCEAFHAPIVDSFVLCGATTIFWVNAHESVLE